jgi:HK97 gp10 family phage protein
MPIESVRIEGLGGVLKTLREIGPAARKAGGPIRKALRKAAKVLQEQEKANLRAIILEPNADGLPNESTGLLEKNIVVGQAKMPPGQKGEAVRVRVRNKRYPPERSGKKAVTTAQVARLLEGGSEKMKAHPFIRPAFDAKKQAALSVFVQELPKDIVALQKKLARANGVKGV